MPQASLFQKHNGVTLDAAVHCSHALISLNPHQRELQGPYPILSLKGQLPFPHHYHQTVTTAGYIVTKDKVG